MSDVLPVVTIQSDWIDLIRLKDQQIWISVKYIGCDSAHGIIKTQLDNSNIKIQIICPDDFQYISQSNLSLVVKHLNSGLKTAFVAPTKTHTIHKHGLLSVSCGENALAATSCEGDKFLVWDTRTDEVLFDLKGHGGPVYKCRFFPSNVVLLSAGADGSSRIWSAESGINPVVLKGHKMAITDISIIDKGRNVITVSKDGSAKLWDVGEARCIKNVLEEQGTINCCVITPTIEEVTVEDNREIGTGNKLLIAGCESGRVICFHIAKKQKMFEDTLKTPVNTCLVLDNMLVIGCGNGKIFIRDIEKDADAYHYEHESASPILSMARLSNQMFVVGRQDGTCTVHSLQETHKNLRVQLTGSDCDGIRDIAFNGKWILTASRDKSVRKYDYNQIAVHYK